MDEVLKFISQLLADSIMAIIKGLIHNWLPLSLAIITAVVMRVYINIEKLKQALLRKPNVSILASVAFGAFTPLCACGTMAVVIGLFTTALPWGPIMAFLTSSPLMSPDSFILIAGVVNLKFAIALTIASVIIGLSSGYITHFIEKKTGFLKNQTRFSDKSQTAACACSDNTSSKVQSCGCSSQSQTPLPTQSCCTTPDPNPICCQNPVTIPATACGCTSVTDTPGEICCATQRADSGLRKFRDKIKLNELAQAFVNVGLKQILLFFSIFVGVGYLIQSFVPTSVIMALFSSNSIFSVPLAALIGLPLYVSGESVVPLINALKAGGAGDGAMMAFMITGPATSAWVIAGISTFMRRRVIGLYLSYIVIGGILLGYLYDLIISLGI